MSSYDIVIAGGAMAGMTLALSLNESTSGQLKIAIVEAHHIEHKEHPGFDARCIALSYGTVQILQKYGLWQSLRPLATPIKTIHVSDRSHAGMTDIRANDLSIDSLGYVVELEAVGWALQQKVNAVENIEFICPDRVQSIERSSEQVTIELSSSRKIDSKLLVAADGAGSTCCEYLGISYHDHNFSQTAVIANIVPSEPHQYRAYERFTEYGPVALLPLTDNRMSLVWCMTPEQSLDVMALDDSQFLAKLQGMFGWRLGQLAQVGKRSSYPLTLRSRMQNTSHRFAIVGNAAQTLHPIAGQGFNLGIRDAASLVEEICAAIDDPGQHQVLSRFRTRREQDRVSTIQLTSSLVHLFSNDLPFLRVARNLGLFAMDNIAPLKSPLLKQALGLVDR
ncbi:2-octaprenyl-6-methoxyphenyl hydroxylase [Vibrio sp. S4M6]|uniref:2-octaprenyl-6-methoxyphenyl hydroxylase n=1 Tax=Vibrio sinus TaxID=2946865 RepID=UPI00202A5A95|nr:2-octaprenyl-6-methoxyphenyl hydroxylase [Vibrio sinus]MCL9781562.1 2-octaprenyl-6-methoxyphenyl hydroxylase [Vibrio sinus]